MGFARTLAGRQTCRVHIMEAATGRSHVVHENASVLFEAPNWTSDDELILNGEGVLWRMPADGSQPPAVILHDGLPELNNDHVLAPDGATIFVSANDGHLYATPLAGGTTRRVTRDGSGHWHFLHGVSPDGSQLAYVALNPDNGWDSGTVHTVGIDGGGDTAITRGRGTDDGPEYSPDGRWLYFNTERFSSVPGHAQIARVRPDGTGLEQLTFDARVNWFPHVDPTGNCAVYLSFPAGTVGHPADLNVELRLVDLDLDLDFGTGAWSSASVVAELLGGQGTINVNSWSPDGQHFAYVDYPTSGNTTEAES